MNNYREIIKELVKRTTYIVGIDSKGRNIFEEIKEKSKKRVDELYPLLNEEII